MKYKLYKFLICFIFILILVIKIVANNERTNKILVIVNSNIYSFIQNEISHYTNDIHIMTGFQVQLETYNCLNKTAEELKSFIQNRSNNLIGCVLVGKFTNAWYEIENDYGRYGYQNFPCDLFLMDLDGEWIDAETNAPMQKGVYDSHIHGSGDRYPEIFLGRIDASTRSCNEIVRLIYYFNKNHNYWSGITTLNKYGCTYIDFEPALQNIDFYMHKLYGASGYDLIKEPVATKEDYLTRLTNKKYDFIQLAVHSDPNYHEFLDKIPSMPGYLKNYLYSELL